MTKLRQLFKITYFISNQRIEQISMGNIDKNSNC